MGRCRRTGALHRPAADVVPNGSRLRSAHPPAARPAAARTSVRRLATSGSPAAFAGYQSLTITRPAQEQVLWNIEGQLDVAAAVQPALQPGHALQFHLDGRMMQAEPGATQARFPEVFRGEHVLRVDVVDASGRPLVSSPITPVLRASDVDRRPGSGTAPGPASNQAPLAGPAGTSPAPSAGRHPWRTVYRRTDRRSRWRHRLSQCRRRGSARCQRAAQLWQNAAVAACPTCASSTS